jgi:hypothetical protein
MFWVLIYEVIICNYCNLRHGYRITLFYCIFNFIGKITGELGSPSLLGEKLSTNHNDTTDSGVNTSKNTNNLYKSDHPLTTGFDGTTTTNTTPNNNNNNNIHSQTADVNVTTTIKTGNSSMLMTDSSPINSNTTSNEALDPSNIIDIELNGQQLRHKILAEKGITDVATIQISKKR